MHHRVVIFDAKCYGDSDRIITNGQHGHLEAEFGLKPLPRGYENRLVDGDEIGIVGE
jgi:hypothetical protein